MEFNEKLQVLRKEKGLTQEELAEALYVSRTAISKWESGRGYPSIDSLKEISKFFSVTIDDLLSGEKLISIAEKENKSNLRNICDMLFGIVDLMSILLIILPLYPQPMNGYICSVSLFVYTESTSVCGIIYWAAFISLILQGIIKVVMNQIKIKKGRNIVTKASVAISVVIVPFLAMTRQSYAIVIAFLLLMVKCILITKNKGSIL